MKIKLWGIAIGTIALSLINMTLLCVYRHSTTFTFYRVILIAFIGLYFSWTLFALKKKNSQIPSLLALCVILIGLFVVEISGRLYLGVLLSSLSALCLNILTILIAYAVFTPLTKVRKTGLLSLYAILVLFIVSGGISWLLYKYANNSSIIKFDPPISADRLVFQNAECDTVTISQFRDKGVVFYFWTSHDNSNSKDFALLESLYKECQQTSQVEVYAVFCRDTNESCQMGTDIFSQKQYCFPYLSIMLNDSALADIWVTEYPTVLWLNVVGEVIFQGSMKPMQQLLFSYLRSLN